MRTDGQAKGRTDTEYSYIPLQFLLPGHRRFENEKLKGTDGNILVMPVKLF